MKTLKQFQLENKDCCKNCGSYDHATKDCPKIKKEEVEEVEEALSPQDQTKLKNQKRFAQKKLQMDRQKMQLKKAGKLNINHEETEIYWSSKALDQLEEIKKEEVVAERLGGKGYKPRKDYAGRRVSGDWEDSDRGAGNKAKKRAGGTVKKKSPTYLAHVHNKEEVELDELNRYGKETGKATGSLNKPKGSPVKKGGTSSPVMRAVRTSIRKETGKPEGQQKKSKGAKSSAGTGKYLAKAKEKKAYASKAKKAGFKNTQDYTNTMARYGGEDNYKKGRGLGS